MIFVLLVAGAFALATLRRYSVAQTITLTSLAFLLTSWLNSASGVPTNHLQFMSNSSAVETKPWSQPCGTRLAASQRMHSSNDSHNIMKRVRTQLRVAQNHFNKTFKDVRTVYSKVYRVLQYKEQYKMNWLPKRQLEWYHRELWCLEKGKKAERALPRLYDALQRFSITFYELREFQLNSSIDVSRGVIKKRTKIIDKAHNQVLRLLCEVEAAMINLELKTSTLNISEKDNMHWARDGDLTLMLIQDWGVLKLYHTFLKDWIKVFRNATTNNTCGHNVKSSPFTPNIPKRWFNGRGTRISKMKKHRLIRKPGRNGPLRQNTKTGSQRNRLMNKKQKRPTL